MKKINFLMSVLAFLLMSVFAFAQAPQKMSYQAVVRDADNHLVSNTQVGIEINIYQDSVSGTMVYTETQTPTTNANGLLTIEIGGGSGFDTISWAHGPYFLETKIDPEGGTDYTIVGKTQLLSVPFALHAKTAESVTGELNETDPVFSAWDKSYTDLTNKPNIVDTTNAVLDTTTQFVRTEVDGDTTNEIQTITRNGLTVTLSKGGGTYQDSVNVYTAGDGIDIDSNNVVSEHKYKIGDFAQGGIVFWVDETGEHGLVCAKSDQDGGNGIRWYAGTNGNTHARGSGPYAGELNTAIIIAAHAAIGDDDSTYAARLCNELSITENGVTYSDWYLPSLGEEELMYQNKAIIDSVASAHGGDKFIESYYWSSTEYSSDGALSFNFGNGGYHNGGKHYKDRIRPIRSF